MLRKRQQKNPPPGSGPAGDAAAVPLLPSSASPVRTKATASGTGAAEAAGSLHKRKMEPPSERRPLLGIDEHLDDHSAEMPKPAWSRRNQWIVWAIASGACAAFNGVFAKLTTNELTTNLSRHVARLLGLSAAEAAIEFIVRCIFFGLNMALNGAMWTLFTTALARGNSTTQVSIINTSSNFVLTALLGLAIFSESLPPLWWVGASMLIAGNVIIGRKDEGSPSSPDGLESSAGDSPGSDAISDAESGRSDYEPVSVLAPEKSDADEDFPDLGDLDRT